MTRPGSSPHTRGARAQAVGETVLRRIIPAYAGSTPTRQRPSGCRRDHPRIRGEHHMSVGHLPSTTGSSPHTRGARAGVGDAGVEMRIIPAYAGSTGTLRLLYIQSRDHPRIRGEHPWSARSLKAPSGSSPHTRGAPQKVRAYLGQHGIIPAYAGSTTSSPPPAAGHGDHPRIRGEHLPPDPRKRARNGSSPHTRGALLRRQ